MLRKERVLENILGNDTIQVMKKVPRNNNVSTNGNENHVIPELTIFIARKYISQCLKYKKEVTLPTNNLADYIGLIANTSMSCF